MLRTNGPNAKTPRMLLNIARRKKCDLAGTSMKIVFRSVLQIKKRSSRDQISHKNITSTRMF